MGEILVNSLRCNVRVDKLITLYKLQSECVSLFLFGKNINNTILKAIGFFFIYLFIFGTRARM